MHISFEIYIIFFSLSSTIQERVPVPFKSLNVYLANSLITERCWFRYVNCKNIPDMKTQKNLSKSDPQCQYTLLYQQSYLEVIIRSYLSTKQLLLGHILHSSYFKSERFKKLSLEGNCEGESQHFHC